MKKTVFVVASLCTAALFGAQNNLKISFNKSTAAPDTYADGTEVPSGELYALVWKPTGATFAGIAADGSPVDASTGAVVSALPRCKNKFGYFAPVGYQIDAADVATKYKGGAWQVYLLDTRMYGADGQMTVGVRQDGLPVAVNASSLVADAVLVQASGGSDLSTALDSDKPTTADEVTAVPADAPQPEITGIRVVDGKLHVSVKKTVPYLQYNLASGEKPDAVSGKAAESPRNGDATGEIELVAPMATEGGFFRVNRN